MASFRTVGSQRIGHAFATRLSFRVDDLATILSRRSLGRSQGPPRRLSDPTNESPIRDDLGLTRPRKSIRRGP